MATIVDWDLLLQPASVSVAVGLGVLIVGAIAVASSLRADDARRVGATAGAAVYSGVTVVCVLALAAAGARVVWSLGGAGGGWGGFSPPRGGGKAKGVPPPPAPARSRRSWTRCGR